MRACSLNVLSFFQAEELFLRAQAQRREQQIHLNHIQAKLKDLHAEIAKTSRGEDRYLALVTEVRM